MSPSGQPLWGPLGVQLTNDLKSFHADPKIAATSDGGVVVGWTSETDVVLQKLDANGNPTWPWSSPHYHGIVLGEPGYSYVLADMHASDHGSVIISWVRSQGFSGAKYLYANKVSATGHLLWGKKHVKVFDGGSLQFGEFPYFLSDGNGGAVFAWYSSYPNLQCFAQHILADGAEGFPHNGTPASTDLNNVRVEPTVSSRRQPTRLSFSGRKRTPISSSMEFRHRSSTQRAIANGQHWARDCSSRKRFTDLRNQCSNWHRCAGLLVRSTGIWLRHHSGHQARWDGQHCMSPIWGSTASADKIRLFAGIASSGVTALAWEDDLVAAGTTSTARV